MQFTARWNVEAMQRDLADRGWQPQDLARAAHVSHMTVARFFSGKHQTNRTGAKLARALKHKPSDYLMSEAAVAS